MDGGTSKRIGCAFAGDKGFSGWRKRFVQAMKAMESRPAVLAGWLFSMDYLAGLLHMSYSDPGGPLFFVRRYGV